MPAKDKHLAEAAIAAPPLELNKIQKIALDLLIEKRRDFDAAISEQIKAFEGVWGEQVAEFQREVEESLGLEAGSIGSRYGISEDGTIQELETNGNVTPVDG